MINIKPYLQLMRVDRPIGTFLLLWPTLWALWIAGQGSPNPGIVLIFIIGVIIMRASGCIINDYADRDFDKHVTRTNNRPLTTGEISPTAALALFFILICIALLLVLQLNTKAIFISVFALGFAIVYPFSKRFTQFPQALLGIAFSLAILMAFAAIDNSLPLVAWLLFITNICWTVAYDTQYAMVDKQDDLSIGIKSTAILFGDNDRLYIGLLQITVLLLLVAIGYLEKLNDYFFLSLAVVGLFFIYQQALIYYRDEARCFKAFLNNSWVGAMLFGGIILGLIEV